MSWQSEVEVYLAMMMVERRSSFDFGMPCIQVQASYYFFGRMIQILILRTYRYINYIFMLEAYNISTPFIITTVTMNVVKLLAFAGRLNAHVEHLLNQHRQHLLRVF